MLVQLEGGRIINLANVLLIRKASGIEDVDGDRPWVAIFATSYHDDDIGAIIREWLTEGDYSRIVKVIRKQGKGGAPR